MAVHSIDIFISKYFINVYKLKSIEILPKKLFINIVFDCLKISFALRK